MCPPELELGKENLDSSRASFVDLDIKVDDRLFVYNQCDKIDAFHFLLYAFHLCAVIWMRGIGLASGVLGGIFIGVQCP